MSSSGRVRICQLPSPLILAERMSEELGGRPIYVKRDDLLGRVLGGNKLRKLEYICADANIKRADCLVTDGVAASNHATLTAVVGGMLRLQVFLVLLSDRSVAQPAVHSRLQSLSGAEVRFVEYDGTDRQRAIAARLEMREASTSLVEELRRQGRRPYVIPEGGCCPLGSYAFSQAFAELHQQMQSVGFEQYEVFVAVGSGSTYAGLVCGVNNQQARVRVRGVSVAFAAKRTLMQARKAAQNLCESQAWKLPAMSAFEIHDAYLGAGYGQLTSGAIEALEYTLRMEGLLLDPTYTAKAMAGLRDLMKREAAHSPVVFWHTGGVAGAMDWLMDVGHASP